MKNILATITLLAVLAFGSNLAYGGLLVSDFTGGDQTQTQEPCTASDDIIVPTGISIIVPTGFVGIIINEIIKDEAAPSDCIIVPIG